MTVHAETANVERLGVREAVIKANRHQLTPILDVPHSRRKFGMDDYQWADLVDTEDEIRMLISPISEYAKAGAYAMNRAYDNIIIAAASADATDGDGTAVPLPADHKIAAGATGMTMDKVLEAKQILDEGEVDKDNRYMVVNSAAMIAMLGTTEVSSSDFNSIKALVRGEFSTWLGFHWIQTELVDATKMLAYHKSGIRLGIGRDVVTKIDDRPDVSYAKQCYLAFTAGASRMEECKVVEIGVA